MYSRCHFKMTLVCMALCSTAQANDADYLNTLQNEYRWRVLSVKDGDTMRVDGSWLPLELSNISVRVMGIDTPEKGRRAKCEQEAQLGERATARAKELIANAQEITFRNIKWDKYGGRIDASVYLDGVLLNDMLIAEGLAREYNGGKKSNWCD